MYSSEGPGLKSQLGPGSTLSTTQVDEVLSVSIYSAFTHATCVSVLTLIGVGVRHCLGVELGAEPSPS